MAFHTGKEGIVKIGASPVVVAEVKEWGIETTGETADATTMNSAQANGGWRSNVATLKSWSGSLACLWDDSDTTGQGALIEGATIALKVYPDGDDSAAVFFSGNAIVTSVSRNSTTEGLTEAAFTFTGTGALTKATVGA